MQHDLTRRGAVAALLATGAAAATPYVDLARAAGSADRRARTPHTIKVATYNVGDKSSARLLDQLAKLVEDHRPHVIGLQEVADQDRLLARTARRTGYRLVRATGRNAVEHNALLVAPGVRVLSEGAPAAVMHGERTVHEATPGTGKNGDTIPPKYINFVRVRVDGLDWSVGTVHLVPSASRFRLNRKVHGLEVRKCAAWFASRKNEPVVMGDWNAEPGTAERPGLMKDLRKVAQPFARPSFEDGRSIDHVWARKNVRGKVRALGGYGVDHRPVVATLTARR